MWCVRPVPLSLMQGMATLEVIVPLSEITGLWGVEGREDHKHHLPHCSTVRNLQENLIGEVIFELWWERWTFPGRTGYRNILSRGTMGNKWQTGQGTQSSFGTESRLAWTAVPKVSGGRAGGEEFLWPPEEDLNRYSRVEIVDSSFPPHFIC